MRRIGLFLPVLVLLAALAGCGSSGGPSSTGGSTGGSSSSGGSTGGSESGPVEGGPVAPSKPLSGAVAEATFAPWPGFAHDGRHGGAAAVVGPQTGKVRWQSKLEGAVVPGPAVGKGNVVYAASNGGVLHAIDLKSGKDIWTFDGGGSYGSDTSIVPALLTDGTVLWSGPENTLFALDSSGKSLWQEQLGGQPLSPLVLKDGSIVVGDTAGTIEDLVPAKSGPPSVAWEVELGGTSFASPALGPEGTVYTTTEENLFAIQDGKVAWKFPASQPSEVSPAVAADGTVIFGTNDSEYGISPAGKELWRHPNGTRTYSSPIVTRGGLVYYGDNHGLLSTLEAGSGKLLSRIGVEQGPGIWTSAAVDSHHDVYYGATSGDVFGYGADGKQLFDLKVDGKVDSYPALAADGTLLIGTEAGTLYAIR